MDHRRILDLTLGELVEELKDGSLSPQTALYVYVEKVNFMFDLNKEPISYPGG